MIKHKYDYFRNKKHSPTDIHSNDSHKQSVMLL